MVSAQSHGWDSEPMFFLTETEKRVILNRLCTAVHYKKQQLKHSCRSEEIETKLGHEVDLKMPQRVLKFRLVTDVVYNWTSC